MPRAKLSISIPEDVWIHEVSTAHRDVPFRVLTALAAERRGIGLVEVQTADPLSILTGVSRRDDVEDLDLLWKRADEALLQVTTTSPSLLFPVWEAGVPIAMPFTIRDGRATWTVTSSRERFSEFGELLDAADVEYDVEYVREFDADEADRITTDRQREVFLAALDEGYYETPRESTLTEVADRLDISKATCSDVLHRAEGNVLTWFAEEHLRDQ